MNWFFNLDEGSGYSLILCLTINKRENGESHEF